MCMYWSPRPQVHVSLPHPEGITGAKQMLGMNPYHPESQADLQTYRKGAEVLTAVSDVRSDITLSPSGTDKTFY